MAKFLLRLTHFKMPIFVAFCIVAHLVLQHVFGFLFLANLATCIAVAFGSLKLLQTTVQSLVQKKFAVDYIALAAIITALWGQYYLVSAVIALMLSGGYALEEFGFATAKKSLTSLVDRIPKDVLLWENGSLQNRVSIQLVEVGQEILVRKGEVIPLDGILISKFAETDESSITGEPYFLDKVQGDAIRSGTVNCGDPIVVRVTTRDQDSTYRNIINMVKQAQSEKSPLIRMADRYSIVFTILTFFLATLAYMLSHSLDRVLAVLVVATPCPLILATPIALMGGVSSASRYRIIIKRLISLEGLSRAKVLIFDKTGTITLGQPFVKQFLLSSEADDSLRLLGIAAAIERNSLHPLAKAVVHHAKTLQAPIFQAQDVQEKIGFGVTAKIDGEIFRLSKIPNSDGMSIGLFNSQDSLVGVFEFEDALKKDTKTILQKLNDRGMQLFLFTGDKKKRTESLLHPLGLSLTVETDCTPERKKEGVLALRKKGLVTAMIGDGVNDAPALAAADVGLVFSHEEQTAATEAADIVFLGGDLEKVMQVILLSSKTIQVVHQCIWIGIGASFVGMVLAAFGIIPPIVGAFYQEAIDVVVILNALRTSFIKV